MKIDLVIIDYLGLIKYHGPKINSWEELGNQAFNLRTISREKKIPIITASQVGRDALKAKTSDIYDIENIALSILIANHSDVLLSLKINSLELLQVNGVCDLTAAIVKNRDGPKGKFVISANFSHFKMEELNMNQVNQT